MKKYLRHLTIITLCSVTFTTANAEIRKDYQLFPVQVEWTKSDYPNQQAPKVYIPFNFPSTVPDGAEFVGVTGKITATTDKSVDNKGNDNTNSVALLTLFSSKTDFCPTMGANVDRNVYDKTKFTNYFSQIMKQAKSGSKSVDIDFTMPQGLPMDFGPKKCMFIQFDGWEWHGKNYTIKADLKIKYKIPSSNINPNIRMVSLDIEHGMIGAPSLGFIIYPVTEDGNFTNQRLPPGTITSIMGGVGLINMNFPEMTNWNVRSKVVVYKDGSCAKAFPNHNNKRFGWQQNIDNTNWNTSVVIADRSLEGNGRDSAMTQMIGNDNLPIHVEAGDCVAQVFVNSNIHPEYNNHGNLNEESQTSFSFIPD